MASETSDLTSVVRALDAEFIKNANSGDAARSEEHTSELQSR